MNRIWNQKCECKCGWKGQVYECEGDIDGDGNLGCPVCFEIVIVKDKKNPTPRPDPMDTFEMGKDDKKKN